MKKLMAALEAAFLLFVGICGAQTIPVYPYSQGSYPLNGLPKLCGFSSGIPVFCPSGLVDNGTELLYNGSPLAAGGVLEINGLTGNVVFAAGSNVTLTPSGNTITISSTSTASTAFSALTGSTNTSAAMICGTGCSLSFTGSGSIAATSVPASGVSGSDVPLTTVPSAGQILIGNAGGTAYAGVTLSGDSTLTSVGVMKNTGLNGTLLSGLSTGLLKNTTATGVPTIAVAGTDYVVPSGSITGNAANVTGIVAIANGGTGAATASAALTALGAAALASPTFTGVPAAPTATAGTNTNQIATTAFVATAVAAGGGISGLTAGFFTKALSATSIGNTLCDEGITTSNTITCTDSGGIAAASFTGTASGVGSAAYRMPYSSGSQLSLPPNSAGWAGPSASGGTSYLAYLPATATAGLLKWAAPTTIEGQNGTQMSVATIQGTDSNILSAGTISGTGTSLCTDANGGATTSGCPAGSVSGIYAAGSGTALKLGIGPTSFTPTSTLVIEDTTPTTGSTGVIIQGGAGQTGNIFQVGDSNGSSITVNQYDGLTLSGYILNGPISFNTTQTTVNCATSGTAVFTQMANGVADMRVMASLASCVGAVSYTFSSAFTHTPNIYPSSTVTAALVTSLSDTAVTITGAASPGSTGGIVLENY